ncbi:MAG: hypothetical protein ACFFG0_11630 [Candidatus Thorarchaeota archaeon]
MNSRQKRFSHFELKGITIENNWPGQGTEESPYIIGSSFESYLERFTFINSRFFHFNFKNCHFKNVVFQFERCQYLTFENCSFSKDVIIKDSNELRLKECSFSGKVSLIRCREVKIEHCNILNLGLFLSYNNIIKNCRMTKIYNYLSRANLLENNIFPQIYMKSFTKGSEENPSRSHILILSFSYFVGMILTYIPIAITKKLVASFPLIMGIVAIPFSFLIIMAYVVHHPKYKEMMKHPPNIVK